MYEDEQNDADESIRDAGNGATCVIERSLNQRQSNGSYLATWSAIASGIPVIDIGLRTAMGDGGVLVKRRTWLLSGKELDAAGVTLKSTDRISYGGAYFNIRADGLNVLKPDPAGPTILVELETLT